MKHVRLAGMVMVLLAACSGESPPNEANAATSPPVETEAVPASGEAGSLSLFIPGLQLGGSIEEGESSIYASQAGEQRRGFALSYKEGDAHGTMQRLASAFEAAGYRAKAEATTGETGEVRQNFSRDGSPPAFVAVYPPPQNGTAEPAAPGKIWISWALPAGTPPGGATAPDGGR